MNYISYIRLYKNKNRILRKFFFFLVFYNGLYRKTFMPLKKLHIFFNNKLLLRHGMIKFIFGPQQVFFQLFTRNAKTPDTHTTVGTLIRIRENIKEHAGKYVFRNEDKADISARERRRDKKFSMYFRKQRSTENFRNLIVKKKLVQPRLIEDKEQTLQRIKTELLLKHVRKKNKNAEIVIVRNKRGNPKTEPLFGKAQRRRFYM